MTAPASNVLLVVTANAESAVAQACAGKAPRKDYLALQRSLDATLLDLTCVERSRFARIVSHLGGVALAQAWLAFRRRNGYRTIFTDGEHIGIPLALMLKLARARVTHITIGHRLTAAKKRPFFRWLRVQSNIDRIVVHSRRQYELATTELKIPSRQIAFVPYQVDTQFWRPQHVPEERLICSAGLEFRDYPTLIEAVQDLDVHVVIGAASYWSKRANTVRPTNPSTQVEVGSFDYVALRDLYARAAIVVVPLADIDFQAGVTTILEAMAMAKPVIVTHSTGQTDVVEDRRASTRGAHPRLRPESLLRRFARSRGFDLQPNGFYVAPEDPTARGRREWRSR